MDESHQSWGRVPKVHHEHIERVRWQDELSHALAQKNILPYGVGRSYGDSCLNDGGNLVDVSGLNHFISFNETTGMLRCEAGVTLAQILEVFVPRGFFLPVTPGTKFVTVGGAIANDVHGKNHHVAGTFGWPRPVGVYTQPKTHECRPHTLKHFFRSTQNWPSMSIQTFHRVFGGASKEENHNETHSHYRSHIGDRS